MKLVRFGSAGHERPGVLDADGRVRDVSAFAPDLDAGFFMHSGVEDLGAWLQDHEHACPVVDEGVRLGAPIARPSKIVCVGLNYARHAAESGMAAPEEPVLFFKAPSALSGPFDDVVLPKNSQKVDWEVELAVVIGRQARYVSEADAPDYIAGYAVHNDVSERHFQLERGGQWVKGKSADTFAPLGPYLVTPDEAGDVGSLGLWLSVNGERLQASSTADLIFGVPFLVSYISQYMTLEPGDLISTGTPEGVGLGLDPPRYLRAGDVMELGIDGLGTARQQVRAHNG